MPDLPISGLPAASLPLDGTELFATVQGGITKYSTLNSVNYIPGNSYGLFAQTANSAIITGTTAELSLINGGVGTLSVPANGFRIGDSFRADFGGQLSSKNNDTIRIKVKAGSVILADSGTQTMSTAVNDHTTKQSNGAPQGFAFNTVNDTTFDTTIPNTLDVTAQFSSDSALNSIFTDIFVLNKIY